ncbi:MAG TPA: glutathione S-transferase family protein [Polyangiaceae bacterium]
MRALYHFQFSPFSRRTRLALAHKKLAVELRDAREPAAREEAGKLVAFRTIPVLVDGERALGDSTAIAHYLDAAYPDAPGVWPQGDGAAEALQVAALVDVVLDNVINLGTRYWALRGDAAWEAVKGETLGRARDAADALGQRVARRGGATIAEAGWSGADMWLMALVLWFESMPPRAATSPNIAQVMSLGLELPRALTDWAKAHRGREDVKALA